MASNKGCPICKRPDAARTPPPQSKDAYRVECGGCGKFVVQATLEELVWDKLDENGSKKLLLVSYLPVYIKEENKKKIEPEISSENWEVHALEGRRLAGHSST